MSGHKSWKQISTKLRSDPARLIHIEQLERTFEAELTISQFDEAHSDTQENVEEERQQTESIRPLC